MHISGRPIDSASSIIGIEFRLISHQARADIAEDAAPPQIFFAFDLSAEPMGLNSAKISLIPAPAMSI